MSELNAYMIDKIVKECLDKFASLPKNGKPNNSEWTVLSCMVQLDMTNEDIKVVSLGTGSKCIGSTKMDPSGMVLNDSHAEVFARRGLLLYLNEQMNKAMDNTQSIFVFVNGKYKLCSNIEFIFYSSQLPCGDASIIPKTKCEESAGEYILNLPQKRPLESDDSVVENKKHKSDSFDIHRTGAKCLPHSEQDPKESGLNYHLLGQVRIKPGRGDRTLSVSCSDKMAKWVYMGVQGSLLDMLLLEPIYIRHFIFGAGVPYSEETLRRALLKRNSDCKVTPLITPLFYQSSLVFPNIKCNEKPKPTPTSILMVNLQSQLVEIAVNGIKLGVTKANAGTIKSALNICKYYLYKKFLLLVLKYSELKESIFADEDFLLIPYNEMKRKSVKYMEKWSVIKENFFKTWTTKPDIWQFEVLCK